MANKEVNIYFKVDGLDGYITDLGDLRSALNQVDVATEQATAATDELISQYDKAGDLEGKIRALEGGVKVLAGSAELAAGAFGLLGADENPFFQEVEKNVINVIALAQGAIDLSEGFSILAESQRLATVAQTTFNVVANANPYVLLATAIIGVATAIGIYTVATSDSIKETKKDFDLKEELLRVERDLGRLRESVGARALDIADLESGARQQALTDIQNNIDITNQEIDSLTRQRTALLQSSGGYAFMTEAQKDRYLQLETTIGALEEEIKVEQEVVDQTNKIVEARKKEKEATEDSTEAAGKYANALFYLDEALDTILDSETSLYDELASREQARLQAAADTRQEEIDLAEQDYFRQLTLAGDNAELRLQVEEDFRKTKAEINKKYDDLELQRQEELDAAVLSAEYALQDSKFAAANAGFQLLSSLAGENERLQNVLFVAEKAAAIANVFVNAARAKGANIAYAASLGPAGPAYLTAANQAVNINSAAQIATIAATTIAKFKNGGGAAGIESGSQTPNIGASVNYNFGQTAGQEITLNQQGGQQPQPIQAYVLASDVNNAQQTQQAIDNLSRL